MRHPNKSVAASSRSSSSQEVCEYYMCLAMDAQNRTGQSPENCETLPRLIHKFARWKYYSHLPLLTLQRVRYWYRDGLPPNHLSCYLTSSGRKTNLLFPAKQLLALMTEKNVQNAHADCYNRPQTQAYLNRIQFFIDLYHAKKLPPQSAVIASTGRLPFSEIVMLDGNTRILAAACFYLQEKRLPELAGYFGSHSLF